jgi:hypothetical protein
MESVGEAIAAAAKIAYEQARIELMIAQEDM